MLRETVALRFSVGRTKRRLHNAARKLERIFDEAYKLMPKAARAVIGGTFIPPGVIVLAGP